MAKNKNAFILILILFLGSLIRFWKLGLIPPGLFGDEVDTGYQAFSILNTGKDYFGNIFPVHFQSFGDWRVPLYIYLDAIFIKLFGLSELAVRLPSVLLGILGVLVTFLVAKKITKDSNVSLFSAFLMAISPWHIQISRIGLEAIFLPVLFPLGIFSFVNWLEKKNIRWLISSGILLSLSVYAYNTPKLFLPMIVLAILILWHKEFRANIRFPFIFLATILIILIPMFSDFLKGSGQARFFSISIFSDPQINERVRVDRENCDFKGTTARIIHNKATVISDIFVKNYLSSFSTEFLFSQGDPNPRHSIGDRGEMYLPELLFMLVGLMIVLLKAFKERQKIYQLMVVWLILTPIPAALTLNGGTHAIRLFSFLPWLEIVSAIGIVTVGNFIQNRKIKCSYYFGVVCLLSFSLLVYSHEYFSHYPKISGRWWNYGYREIFDYVDANQDKYDKIYISSGWEPPMVYVMFYSKYSVRNAQKELTIHSNRIGKYYFSAPRLSTLINEGPELKTLYVLTPGELESINYNDLGFAKNSSIKYIKEIKAPDGSTAFAIFSSIQ